MATDEISTKMDATNLSDPSNQTPTTTTESAATAPAAVATSPATNAETTAPAPPPPGTLYSAPIGPEEPVRPTAEEVMADLNKSPLFMTEMESAEENDDIAALQAMAYEGTPLENALDFRERGNECFKVRGYVDAREFYKKGVDMLWLEERKRRLAGKVDWLPVEEKKKKEKNQEQAKEEEAGNEGNPEELSPEEEARQQRELLEMLHVNRAACELELANYRSCWLDCMAALRLNPLNIKAYYRASRALLRVDRLAEADDMCARGLALEPKNRPLRAAGADIVSRAEVLRQKQAEEAARAARERLRVELLKVALEDRGIVLRESGEKPPELHDAVVRIEPDEYAMDDPKTRIVFPVVLLYPLDLQTDFVKAFGEDDSLRDHLSYIFPLPWDVGQEKKERYTLEGVECYVETAKGTLLKMGKKVALLKVLEKGRVEVVDGVVTIFVVPVDGAAAWVAEWKEAKAKQAGMNAGK